MNKTEIENKMDELGKEIAELIKEVETYEATIKEYKAAIEKLKSEAEKPAFERAKENDDYYCISESNGEIKAMHTFDDYLIYDSNRFKNNNYFHTKERAEEVADKINFLLKLERLHDMFCPDYKPDWEDGRFKWSVLFTCDDKEYITIWTNRSKRATVYFDSMETADKVCEILNKELENA